MLRQTPAYHIQGFFLRDGVFLVSDGLDDVSAAGDPYAADLFGQSIAFAGRKRGRPLHVPSSENRRKIEGVLALGGTLQQAADAVAISLNTLKRHYRDLTDHYLTAMIRLEAQMMACLIRQAETNPAAADKVLKRIDRIKATMMMPKAKPPKLGKKEQARIDAFGAGAGTDWADILPGVPDAGDTLN
jgi:hypothetical protein